jgi:hypothetical protein
MPGIIEVKMDDDIFPTFVIEYVEDEMNTRAHSITEEL